MTEILIHAKQLQVEGRNKENSAHFLAYIIQTQSHKLRGGGGSHCSSLGT